MSDLPVRDLARDCRGGPWPNVREVEHCPVCRGAMPPDVKAACSTCGTGTPKPPPPPVVPAAIADFIANARPGDRLDLGVVYRRPPPEPDPPKLTWWERFARWSHP